MKLWLDFRDWLGRWLYIASEKIRTRRWYTAQHKRWADREVAKLEERS